MYSRGPCQSAQAFLGLLEEQPRHGYELKRAYDGRFGRDRPLQYGQVYSTLARLLKRGFVEVDGVEAGGGPERKRYAITDAGVADVERWLAEPEPPEPYLQSTLYAKVALALLTGRGAQEILDTQRAEHLRAMRELTRRKADGRHRRPARVRPRAVPPRGRPAVAGADRRAARRARRGGARMSLLEAHGLEKSFGRTPALDGAGLAVDAGEVVAVMGPSGSGQVHAPALPGRDRARRTPAACATTAAT